MPIQRYKNLPQQIKVWHRNAKKRPKEIRILEIGVYYGHRGKLMVEFCIHLGLRPIYYGFDLFDDLTPELLKEERSKPSIPPNPEEVERYINKRGRAEIHLVKGNTKETLPAHIDSLPDMDFVFIDGGHSEETVRNDWCHCRHILKRESILVFDDYYHNLPDSYPRMLIDEIMSSPSYRTEMLDPVDSFMDPRLDIGMVKIERAAE